MESLLISKRFISLPSSFPSINGSTTLASPKVTFPAILPTKALSFSPIIKPSSPPVSRCSFSLSAPNPYGDDGSFNLEERAFDHFSPYDVYYAIACQMWHHVKVVSVVETPKTESCFLLYAIVEKIAKSLPISPIQNDEFCFRSMGWALTRICNAASKEEILMERDVAKIVFFKPEKKETESLVYYLPQYQQWKEKEDVTFEDVLIGVRHVYKTLYNERYFHRRADPKETMIVLDADLVKSDVNLRKK